jgi:hypothetical protein
MAEQRPLWSNWPRAVGDGGGGRSAGFTSADNEIDFKTVAALIYNTFASPVRT